MIRFVGQNTAKQLLVDVGLRVEQVIKPESFGALRDGMRGITAIGKVFRVGPTEFRRKSDGSVFRFAHAILEADGRKCDLTLWGAEIDLVKPGADVRVINGYTKEYGGVVSLQSGKFGRIEVLESKKGEDSEIEAYESDPNDDNQAMKDPFVPKGTCRHCGRTIQFGSVDEHESKCAASKA